MTRAEQETIIRFDEEGDNAVIYTASSRVAQWLERELKSTKTTNRDGEITSWEFELPKSMVRVKPGKKQLYIGGKSARISPGEAQDSDLQEAN